jgi:hypothetical protein
MIVKLRLKNIVLMEMYFLYHCSPFQSQVFCVDQHCQMKPGTQDVKDFIIKIKLGGLDSRDQSRFLDLLRSTFEHVEIFLTVETRFLSRLLK